MQGLVHCVCLFSHNRISYRLTDEPTRKCNSIDVLKCLQYKSPTFSNGWRRII